jgi:2-polyprenyl-3-methyl-5-hydroxy-6-metoxy-1,4-benzoquinol methylase
VVLYEGHDSDEVEVGRLQKAGFVNVKKVALSERGRGVFLAKKEKRSQTIDWQEFEKKYNLVGAPYHVPMVTKGDGRTCERVYLKTEVWKVRLSSEKNPAKFASPHEESQYLKNLRGVDGVCRLKEYREKKDHSITVLEFFPNIGTLQDVQIPPQMRKKVEDQKHRIIQEVNSAGVLHNDMYDRNFLVNADYELCLIDFDQSQPANGRNDYDHGYYFRVPRASASREETGASQDKIETLEKAWDIAARSNASYPGKYVAYYSLNLDGKQFSGERPWEDRWSYIGPALREACGGALAGKKILELGCNLGLLSVWAAREGAECHGYEYAADILEGGKLVASAFGVDERCAWQPADLNRKDVTDAITYEADVCTCLSVMNWVNNKDNLIEFLSRQKVVLYEGHDSDEVEVGRLQKAGFVNVKKVALSERGRGVFLAKKTEQ